MSRKEKTNSPRDLSRRSLLNRLWTVIGILALVEFAWLGVSIFTSRRKRQSRAETEKIIVAGRMDDFSPNTVTAIPRGQFYLACLEDGSFLAMSRTCTHLGCSVPWDEDQHKFICPCHGSTYSLTGEVLTAPAPRPLDIFPLRIENRVIKVNIAQPKQRDGFEISQVTRLG